MTPRGRTNGPLAVIVALAYVLLFGLAVLGQVQRQRASLRSQRRKSIWSRVHR